ncbi:hypothetical protein [Mycobacterium uberis]|uniref:hypothetical protein n=1 Tax=Mycobacterium uberis TaxID=2162698 RepID=UPI001FB41315|nr:hypothetical protein [Mycobacterium uberis]
MRPTRMTLDLPTGARLTVTGASKAVKMTLLSLLRGQMILDGVDVSQLGEGQFHSNVSTTYW